MTAREIEAVELVPPHNLEAEVSLLGSLLLDPEGVGKVADFLKPEDFYDERHQLIFEAMVTLYEQRRPVDLVTVTEMLKSQKQLTEIGGASFLSSLVNLVPSAAHLVSYADIVSSKATLRRLIAASREIERLGVTAGGKKVDEVLDQAEQLLFSVSQKYLRSSLIPIREVLGEAFERIDQLHEHRGALRGLPTGFNDLDELLAGLQRGDLIIVASRPGMGKTSLALSIARHLAVEAKKAVGIFSLEMSREQLVDRLISAQAGVDAWRLRTGQLQENDFVRIGDAMNRLAEAPIYLDDTPSSTSLEMRTKARRLQAEKGLDLVIVDYLQLMESVRRSDNRVQEISEISRSLKALAKELSIPVIAISQLSREVEKRTSRVPQLSDLRESGSIEQDADVVLFIYRDEYYNKETEQKNLADIIISKHRNGPLGVRQLFFRAERMSFENLEKRRETELAG